MPTSLKTHRRAMHSLARRQVPPAGRSKRQGPVNGLDATGLRDRASTQGTEAQDRRPVPAELAATFQTATESAREHLRAHQTTAHAHVPM